MTAYRPRPQWTPASVAHAPGPKTWIPGGSVWDFRGDRLVFVTRMAREYGDVARFTARRQRVFLVSRPEWIEDVLVQSAKRFAKGVALERSRVLPRQRLLTNAGAGDAAPDRAAPGGQKALASRAFPQTC